MKKYVKSAAEPDLSVQDTLDRLDKVMLDISALEDLHWGEDGWNELLSAYELAEKVERKLQQAQKYFD